ncbi:stage II sporulation protein M [Halalkalibacter krulwichiae]|nr:stage II sporulation protein M [Halalkalibacter krulwichiae]
MKVLLIISICLFVVTFSIGFLTGDYLQLIGSQDQLEKPDPGMGLTFDLFVNNLFVCLILMSGIFLFSIPTFFLLMLNGFFLGTGVKSLLLIGLDIQEVLLKLLPHAIFEVVGFLISASIGLLGLTFYFNSKKELTFIKKGLISVFFLILAAAFIEGFITAAL